jgi:MFS family permease
VTCINTALMGLIIGIYAGEVPAIQYAIVDENHYTILGNVVFFLGLAITTFLAWPLPLLHGRKPYTLAAFALILPLQFPQALAVGRTRSPYVATYRVALLLPRAIAGVVMGFANINFKTTLLDLFGASLQSANPHQEVVSSHDVRRHGGGMGVWLGIWTWCSIGSIGIGFLIGAVVIGELDVAWGFWLSIILIASALVLNVLVPEVRRSAYRRSMAEVRRGSDISRRVARGEIKMHLDSTGPMWWGEEVMAGHRLSLLMLKQPGFAVLALYIGWIYGQIIMLIVVSRRTTLV